MSDFVIKSEAIGGTAARPRRVRVRARRGFMLGRRPAPKPQRERRIDDHPFFPPGVGDPMLDAVLLMQHLR